MKRGEIALLIAVCAGIFFLVYAPHWNYHYPLHVDEWHHITEGLKLGDGYYSGGSIGYRLGFHILLAGLSYFFDLVRIYEYLPALWAVVSGLVIFFVVRAASKNTMLAFLSMIFFAAIKSNVNTAGSWFFTPLSFSIPFIFLFLYFFAHGLTERKKSFLMISFTGMLLLVFVHSLSLLFAIPLLLILGYRHRTYVIAQWRFFSLFLLIPLTGIIFYGVMNGFSFFEALVSVLPSLAFGKNWGEVGRSISLFEIYSPVACALAVVGGIALALHSSMHRRTFLFLAWPLSVAFLLGIYLISGISFLAPYPRMLYYFSMGLVFLSAYGLHVLVRSISLGSFFKQEGYWSKYFTYGLKILVGLIILFFVFHSYYTFESDVVVYHLVQEGDIAAFEHLASLPLNSGGHVMAPLSISTVVYPLSGHDPVATLYFYGNTSVVEDFFTKDCERQVVIAGQTHTKYVLSPQPLDCDWNLLYENDWYLYEVT